MRVDTRSVIYFVYVGITDDGVPFRKELTPLGRKIIADAEAEGADEFAIRRRHAVGVVGNILSRVAASLFAALELARAEHILDGRNEDLAPALGVLSYKCTDGGKLFESLLETFYNFCPALRGTVLILNMGAGGEAASALSSFVNEKMMEQMMEQKLRDMAEADIRELRSSLKEEEPASDSDDVDADEDCEPDSEEMSDAPRPGWAKDIAVADSAQQEAPSESAHQDAPSESAQQDAHSVSIQRKKEGDLTECMCASCSQRRAELERAMLGRSTDGVRFA